MNRYADYVIDGVVGRGGSSIVYRAKHGESSENAVALKVLQDGHRDHVHTTRLHREFDFARALTHPHVVTMYDCGPDWLAMELIDGGTIAALTDRSDVLVALGQIAAALDFAHAHGVVHCDVKPTNILLAGDFATRGAILIDFGVARSMVADGGPRPDHFEASLPYSAPEILRGRRPSPAADEYALACTTVELFTGAPPFRAATAMGLIDRHLNRSVPHFSHRFDWMPRSFDSILAKAMAKNPELRYQTCGEFVAVVARALRGSDE